MAKLIPVWVVYGSLEEPEGGQAFADESIARRAGLQVVEQTAIQTDDGEVYLCRPEPLRLLESANEPLRQRALRKLTDAERAALGV